MKRLSTGVVVLICLLLAGAAGGTTGPGDVPVGKRFAAAQSQPAISFVLDGVTLELTTSFLTDASFVTSDPTSAIQMARAVEREPLFREFSITAAPFGTSPPTEAVPVSGLGQAEAYRAALRAHREEQGGRPEDGPVMRLFGEEVTGSTSVVELHVRGEDAVPVAVTEWVVEAGPRIWIVRASRELETSTASRLSVQASEASLSSSSLCSPDLHASSSSLASVQQEAVSRGETPSVSSRAADLPFPSWWDGECDTVNFQSVTGAPAYPLGAEYRGMKACGPRPWADGGPQRWVDFGEGHSQLEWQCPELSKRFLYLAYGIPPYLGNGSQVVWNYDGDLLEKVSHGTPGRAPAPDDVLSYGPTSSIGHTSVVAASDVDASGDGTITVIEQNSSATGYSTLVVSDWWVISSYGEIGWLHLPGWSVEYYSDGALTDRCAIDEETDHYLFKTWDHDAAVGGCPAGRFSTRFSRAVDFDGGNYTFALGYDERARLKVDGETVVDGWNAGEHYGTHHLDPGYHQVSVEFYNSGGDAALTAFWWGPGFELRRDTQDSSRWYAEHWGNQDLWWDPVITVRGGDGALNHDWSWDSPDLNLPVDYFSSRFRRTVALDPGRWQFDLFADDGVRLLIDDQVIVDEWQPQQEWFTSTVTLEGGDHQLVVEHFEEKEVAMVGLDWERVSEAVAPTVWVTAPLTGTLVETCPITVEAQVGADVGAVDRVEFHARYDGRWHHLGDDQTSPYSWVWDCAFVSNQTAHLMVHVWNEAGREFVDLGSPIDVELEHLEETYLPFILKGEPGGF